jgi:hypothetical protein
MRSMPGRLSARGTVAAAVGAAALIAGCGTQTAGTGAGTGPHPSTSAAAAARCTATPAAPSRSLTVGTSENGQVLCVRQGTTVAVFLQGSPARRWSPIQASSAALKPRADGRLMLRLGETGAAFQAVHPGVASVTSSMPSCPTQGGTPSAGPRCKMGMVYHLTLVVTP